MALRKDDPVYYKKKITNLIKQAQNQGLKIDVEVLKNGIVIYFKANNGDKTAITF